MRRRGVAFPLAAVLLAAAGIELASLGLYRLAFGEGFSYSRAQAMRRMLAANALERTAPAPDEPDAAPGEADAAPGEADAAPGERASNNAQVLHPYLGYVMDPVRGRAWDVNDYGFLGALPPFSDDDPQLVSVALVGGSVAENTGIFGSQVLETELSRIPAFAGRPLRLSILALRGMKQPQQLLVVDWLLSLGARFDVLVNLDGFNEQVLAGENAMQGTSPYYPRRWRVRVEGIQDPQDLALLGRIDFLRDLRARLAGGFADSLLRYSITANLVQREADRRIAGALEDARSELNRRLLAAASEELDYQARGPAVGVAPDERSPAALAAYWRRTSLLLHQRAEANGFRYFHFLQPNQWVEGSKPFGDAERAVARPDDYFHREAAIAGFPALIEAGRELTAAGVAFRDLTPLFRDVEEPRYVDPCCHLNLVGYQEVAAAIAREIQEAYARDAGP